MVLRPQFDARQLLADIDAFDATVLPAVPFIFDYLVRLESAPSPLSRLHLAITAGAPITFEVIRAYAERFSRKIHAFYGTSETGGIAYDDSAELDTAVPVGRPMPETSVSLVAQPGRPGDEGRVHVVGNALGLGYASADDEPEPGAFVDGGFLTGDLARRDREGRLVLTGRVSRFVNVAGRKVHPEEVERVIGQATGVDDVLVLGVPWPARGEVMVACVRCPEPRMTAESLRLHCSERLPPYKVPRSFLFLESFPVDARGKIDRDALARLAAGTTLRDR
jgi:long-chain acyl-CoA synthetase